MKEKKEFNPENYTQERLTIDVVWANIFAIILFIPAIILYGLPYYLIWVKEVGFSDYRESIHSSNTLSASAIFLIALVVGVVVHELIHGVFWAHYAKDGFKSIQFGVMLKMLTPYCHCKAPLKVKHYIIGAIMPAILLGVIPGIIAVCIGNVLLLTLGIFFTVAASGDFLIIKLISKENKDDWVQDHPSEVGCFIYRAKKISNDTIV
jgi:hypothetical protein